MNLKPHNNNGCARSKAKYKLSAHTNVCVCARTKVVFLQVKINHHMVWLRNEQSGRPPPTALSRRTKVGPNSCLEHGERSPWHA